MFYILNSTYRLPAFGTIVPPLVAQCTPSLPSAGPAWSPAQIADKRVVDRPSQLISISTDKYKRHQKLRGPPGPNFQYEALWASFGPSGLLLALRASLTSSFGHSGHLTSPGRQILIKFIQTLNNDKKPFNSIFNSKRKTNYSFKEFIH